MAINDRLDSGAANREELTLKETFSNEQRGDSKNGDLDRSASSREGNGSQMFISGANTLQGSSASSGDSGPLAQSSTMDPITIGGRKYNSSGGNTLGVRAVQTANPKSRVPARTEKLKRFNLSIQEAAAKARHGSKKLDESVQKLNKYWEAVNSKKQCQNELLENERVSESHLPKMGSQTHQSPTELANQRLEDSPKNAILNKRICTSAAEITAEGQNNSSVSQPLTVGNDRDNIKDGGKVCDAVEEKTPRVPASGETWDRKAEIKCSMGSVFAGSTDGEGGLKRVESGLRSCDAKGLRSSGNLSSNSKHHVPSLPASSNSSVSGKNEQENVSTDSMDVSNKERAVLTRNKSDFCDKNDTSGIHPVTIDNTKTPQTANLITGNSSSVYHSSETLEASEQPSNVNKPHSVSGIINRKRTLPAGSPISHIAQWVGQRPQKITRTRRANVVSPVLNYDEIPVPLEGCSPSDVGSGVTSTTTSGSKLKEEGLDRNKGHESAIDNSCNISSYMSVTNKEKMPNKEEIGVGQRRQYNGSSDFSALKTGISSMNEKLEILTLTKPNPNMNPSSEKNTSSRQPRLKKSRYSKAISHIGLPSTSNSPDIAGRSGDDREELLSVANIASNASYIGCSSSFWKKMEPNFAPVNLEAIVNLKQLVKTIEDDQRCLSHMFCLQNDAPDGVVLTDNLLLQIPLEGEIGRSILNQTDSKELSSMVDMVDQHHHVSFLCSQMDSRNKPTPLHQRVLAALIIDDQTEETVGDGNLPVLYEEDDSLLDAEDDSPLEAEDNSPLVAEDNSPLEACVSLDIENQFSINRTEHGFGTDIVSCSGNSTLTRGSDIHVQEIDNVLGADHGPCSSSLNRDFDEMSMEDKLLLELQSVGLCPEQVPDLDDEDYEDIDQDIIQDIDQDIIQLQKGRFEQLTKKRECFMKLIQAVEEGREVEQRALEQVAMDKLVELAYKKKLATRIRSAAKFGLPKVSRPLALSFMKRTLARCWEYEETGESCFLDPVLKDVLFATPACVSDAVKTVAENRPLAQNSQQESALSGSFPCREQNVLGNPDHPSDQDFASTGPMLNTGEIGEVIVDDVGVGAGASSSPTSTLAESSMDGATRKRRGRKKGKYTYKRKYVKKRGRPSASNTRSDSTVKAEPMEAQPSSSANGTLGTLVENSNSEHQLVTSGNNRKGEAESVSHGHNTNDLTVETVVPLDLANVPVETVVPLELANIPELDSVEAGVDKDLNSWFNIDVEALQEDDDAVGLDIPMDDLSMVL